MQDWILSCFIGVSDILLFSTVHPKKLKLRVGIGKVYRDLAGTHLQGTSIHYYCPHNWCLVLASLHQSHKTSEGEVTNRKTSP